MDDGNLSNEPSKEDIIEGIDDGISNIIQYLLSVHNGLMQIVLGTHPENKELLVIPEQQYLEICDNLSATARDLAEKMGYTVEIIENEETKDE
jgi:hypothetical protein